MSKTPPLDLLQSYELASGQCMNFDKSAMVFSDNVTELDSQCFRGLTGIKVVKEHSEYLGLPTSFGRKKKARFSKIVERVSVNTKGWKEKLLSVVGKEILIKAVAQAIPNYAMSCFLLPKGVCDDIEKIIRDFWWGDTKDKRKLHWVSWENLKLEKDKGGMGFKDLRSFNIAMLAKQAWRLLTHPNTLLGSILAHKYYRNGSILSAKSSDRISFAFRGILEGRNLLEQGLLWRIGDGRSIDCFKDKWLPRPTTYRPISTPPTDTSFRVSDFIRDREWDMQKLEEVFLDMDVDLIKTIAIPVEEGPDDFSWMFSHSGVYTVSSGYRLHRSLTDPQPETSTGVDRGWLRKLWNLKLPRKISVPVWRAWRESLPVASNIRRRGLNVPVTCSFCGNGEESSDHLFLYCPFSVGVWNEILPSHGRRTEMTSFKEWIGHCFAAESLGFCQVFATTIWALWYHRNKIRFEGLKPDCNALVADIHRHLIFFLQNEVPPKGAENNTTPDRGLLDEGWIGPPEGWLKVNCDAGLEPRSGRAGLGCVIRNELGDFVAGKSVRHVYNPSVLLLEFRAIKQGLLLAKEAGCRLVQVESDSLTAIRLLSGSIVPTEQEYSGEIMDELEFCRGFTPWFEACSFLHTRRSGNVLAHNLAKHALDIERDILFTEKPTWASDSLYGFSEPVGV